MEENNSFKMLNKGIIRITGDKDQTLNLGYFAGQINFGNPI